MRYFLFGDDAWHRAASWPPPEAVDAPWYLAGPADGEEGGRLLPAPPREAPGHDAFTYDPEDPVPSHGGRVLQLGRLAAGPLNQAHLEDRPDVLCYTSEPLTEPLDVVGRQRLRLRFGSDAPATAVVAKLTDVHPDGRSLLVAEASLRLEAEGTARGTSRTTPICCSGTPRGASPPGTGCGSTSPAATSPIWTGTPTSRARSARRSAAAPPASRSGTAARTRACCG